MNTKVWPPSRRPGDKLTLVSLNFSPGHKPVLEAGHSQGATEAGTHTFSGFAAGFS